jgi:glycosyltransferase involved in cell wall biosynthesis
MAVFLTLYTPTYRRPKALARCQASVAAQTARNFEHLVYHDEAGEGIAGMFQRVIASAPQFAGEYVYLLQDDDWLAGPDVTGALEAFAREHGNPPVIIMRSWKEGRWLPDRWEQPPAHGHIDLGNYAVRRDIFLAHRAGLGSGRYEADFEFIRRLWDAGLEFAWLDAEFSRSAGRSLGQPETGV